MAVDTRHRDKNGEISRTHGNTLLHTLRKTYGPGFATGFADHAKLGDVLRSLDEASLSFLIRDQEAGKLEQICAGKRMWGVGSEPTYCLPKEWPANREKR
jgi:hypothetical protein